MQNPWYFNFVERNDMQLEQLQEEKLLLKITGGSWKFSQGFKLWENMENILHQIASELVCTHSPLTFMHLPITHCWVVINVTILIQEFLCHTTWDGEGFWEVFCIRQVMQNPQVLGGGGVLIRTPDPPSGYTMEYYQSKDDSIFLWYTLHSVLFYYLKESIS